MMGFIAAVLLFVVLIPTPLRTRILLRRLGVSAFRDLGVFKRGWKLPFEWMRPQAHVGDVIPQTLELLARALRAGASVYTAVDTVASDLPEAELHVVVDRVRQGSDMAEALDCWAYGNAERQTVAALLVLGYRSGAAMASSLDRAANSIRQKKSFSDEIRVLTAQTRISGIVVAAAPIGFGAVLALVDHDILTVLFTTPVGLGSLLSGILLEVLGMWWMNRLTKNVAVWE